MNTTVGFSFEERSSNTLPEGYNGEQGDISWFLNSYKHPDVSENEELMTHIEKAIHDVNLNN